MASCSLDMEGEHALSGKIGEDTVDKIRLAPFRNHGKPLFVGFFYRGSIIFLKRYISQPSRLPHGASSRKPPKPRGRVRNGDTRQLAGKRTKAPCFPKDHGSGTCGSIASAIWFSLKGFRDSDRLIGTQLYGEHTWRKNGLPMSCILESAAESTSTECYSN